MSPLQRGDEEEDGGWMQKLRLKSEKDPDKQKKKEEKKAKEDEKRKQKEEVRRWWKFHKKYDVICFMHKDKCLN